MKRLLTIILVVSFSGCDSKPSDSLIETEVIAKNKDNELYSIENVKKQMVSKKMRIHILLTFNMIQFLNKV